MSTLFIVYILIGVLEALQVMINIESLDESLLNNFHPVCIVLGVATFIVAWPLMLLWAIKRHLNTDND